jgi:hypothetical protein
MAEKPIEPFVAAGDLGVLQADATPLGSGLPQHEGGAGGRVDLHAVVGLDDFHVPVGIQRGGDLLGQADEEVHAKRHVPGADDGGVAGGGLDPGKVLGLKAGGADDVDGACLGGEGREFDGRGWGGEVDNGLRPGESLERVVGDGDADGRAAHRLAHVAADPGMTRAFDASHEVQLVGGLRQADQRLPHPPRGPCHHQSRTIAHAAPPAVALP